MTAYFVTWIVLVALATLSLLVSSNIAIALAIASAKAVLVAAIFMHLARDRASHRLALAIGVAFFLLLVVGVLADVGTRDLASAYVR
jgi:caa(3)-type oxidase subunit IV